MKRVLFIICIIFTVGILQAQQNLSLLAVFNNYEFSNQNDIGILFLGHKSVPKSILGNSYLFDWQNALLISKNNKVYSLTARYAPFGDEFQIMHNQQQKSIYPSSVRAIIVENRLFVSSKYEADDASLIDGFFELLCDGDIQLMQRYIPVVKKIDEKLYVRGVNTKLYYQKIGYDSAVEIKSLKKQLPKIFEEHHSLALKIINDNSLDLSNESHVKQLFKIFNDIVETRKMAKSDY